MKNIDEMTIEELRHSLAIEKILVETLTDQNYNLSMKYYKLLNEYKQNKDQLTFINL